jgi:hypothetical protein
MLEHRFRDFWNETENNTPGGFACGSSSAFVLCPCLVMQSMSATQQTQAEQLYRLAFEQALAQISKVSPRRFEFSSN